MLSDDCADALYFLIQNYYESEPINVGTGKDLTILELARSVMKVLDVDFEIGFDYSRPDGMIRKLTDVSKINKLGWGSKISLEDGINIAYTDFLKKYG